MRIEILKAARLDLGDAAQFYEKQRNGLGRYFLHTLKEDIGSLKNYAGIHPRWNGRFRMLARRFPYAIYYNVGTDAVQVVAVLDCRRDPDSIRDRLGLVE